MTEDVLFDGKYITINTGQSGMMMKYISIRMIRTSVCLKENWKKTYIPPPLIDQWPAVFHLRERSFITRGRGFGIGMQLKTLKASKKKPSIPRWLQKKQNNYNIPLECARTMNYNCFTENNVF